jgi:hypothetical protein
MLSHQDVHFLTGLLQIVTSPRPVEVELGSMVLDDAAETERDVDVTVRYQLDNSAAAAMVGLEVKDHARPLDVTHVEQLGAKMNDMSAITDRAIVSASGYSNPAVRKARAHGIQLLELESWDPRDDVFPTGMADWKTFREGVVAWDGFHMYFNPKEPSSDELQAALKANSLIVDEAGRGLETPKDVFSLIDMTARQVSAHYSKTPEFERLVLGERGRIEITVDFEVPLYVQVGEGRRALVNADVIGNLYLLEHQHPVHFLRLVDVIDQRRPIAGCGLAEMSSGELMGITTRSADNSVSVIRISAEDRQKVVVRRRRLR